MASHCAEALYALLLLKKNSQTAKSGHYFYLIYKLNMENVKEQCNTTLATPAKECITGQHSHEAKSAPAQIRSGGELSPLS